MKRLAYISFWALAILVGTCLAACTFHEEWDASPVPEGDSYLRLHLTFVSEAPNTRAVTPEGDENGDGRENAHFNENNIYNICFFIYNDGGKLFTNADPATSIKYSGYVGGLTLTGAGSYTTAPIKIKSYTPVAGDRIIVLANVGDKTSAYTTVGQLQNAEIARSAVWSSSTKIKDYNMFAMSSCTDDATYGKVDDTPEGSYANPFTANVEIERIAARVDWVLPLNASSQPDLNANGAKYSVSQTGTEGTMYITDIRMVNDAVSNTYLIRRTAPTVGGAVTYMGKQTVDTKNRPQSYVITPTSVAKGSETTYATWFDASRFSESQTNTSFFSGTTYKVYDNANSTTDRFSVDGNWCYTIGYTMENTMTKEKQNNNLRTGLLLKSVFVPTTVYTCASVGATPAAASYTKGSDFWYYEDKLDRTKSMFFLTETDLDNYANGKSAYDYQKHHYVNGVCYYYIWIKHAGCEDPALEGTYPMEYAIVRNNIYRIQVETVLSIGTPTPEFTKEAIRVRKWNKRVHPEILL